MKKQINLFIILIIMFDVILQAQEWTGWTTVYQEGNPPNEIKVQISFKVKGCYEYSPYSFYRIKNEFKTEGYVKFKFDYINCNDKKETQDVDVALNKQGIDQEMGMWFLGSSISRECYDIKCLKPTINKVQPSQDFVDKFNSIYDNWKQSLADAYAQYKGSQGLPNVGSILMEWGQNINDSKMKVEQLKTFLEEYTSNATKDLETKIIEFQSEYNNFVTRSNSYYNHLKEIDSNNKIQQPQIETSQQSANQQQEIEEQQKALMNQINRASQKQVQIMDDVVSGLSAISDYLFSKITKSHIEEMNNERKDAFDNLRDEIEKGTGDLVDCEYCNGEGVINCDDCNGKGVIKCSICDGTGYQNCFSCGGTGHIGRFVCTACAGRGYNDCTTCLGKGTTICTKCYGVGKKNCTYCSGTGKKFVEKNEP